MQTFIIDIETHKDSQVGYLPVALKAENFKDAMERVEKNLFPGIFSCKGSRIGEVKIKHIPHVVKDDDE
jgi:hypothetical protein